MNIDQEIFSCLTHSPKTLSNLQWLHYDDEGSFIFDKIVLEDEYYVARNERLIFESNSDDIILKALGSNEKNRLRIVELGAGTASKTSILLSSAIKHQGSPTNYFPIDISLTALAQAQSILECLVPDLCIIPQIKNYVTEEFKLPNFTGCTLVIYIGLSIGNFCLEEATKILDHVHNQLKLGDALLISVDMCQDSQVLLSAYNDQNGVTAEFHFNVLRRLNREFGYHFDLNQFRYRPVWNKDHLRVEKHLESLCSQQIKVINQYREKILHFNQGETIHIEDSYKFTHEKIKTLLINTGFQIEDMWNDQHKWIYIILARISPLSFQKNVNLY